MQQEGRMKQGGKARPALLGVVPDKTTVVVWDLWHAEVTHMPSEHKNVHSEGSGVISARRQ